jgi:hypothetical protein
VGCDEPLPPERQWEFQGIKFDRCPNFYLREGGLFAQQSLELYTWREKGFLPYPGTWTDQPNIVIEVIEFIERLCLEKHESERKTMEMKAKGKHGR